ncbi:MAG: hypothetical protein QGH51_04245 [Planctomycetota bacterium]|jgi:tetratricopeptide (TPR) repeat protein|nr:hypothetical protein [Planctomycetota bacterium]MDP6941220.1 hypothetical protein [Planctomycetota bacterium]
MYDRTEFLDTIRNARSSSRLLCAGFQRDLSALLDGELGEQHSRRSLAHLETCDHCSEFFQAIRLQALAHRDLAVPGSLAKRIRRLRGQDLFEGLTDSEIVRRLANALYELGKAYVLTANDDGYLLKVAEEPVRIEEFRANEACELAEAAEKTGACCISKEVLEEKSEDFLLQGRKLLSEALSLKPKFAEARLYSGFVHQLMDDVEASAKEYREVFLRTDRPTNRAHAAIQLGQLYDHQGDNHLALRMYRWVVASGLVERKPEFAFVLYNIAVEHLSLGDVDAATAMLQRIRLGYPELWKQSIEWLRQSPELLAVLRNDSESRSCIEALEPEFFAA